MPSKRKSSSGNLRAANGSIKRKKSSNKTSAELQHPTSEVYSDSPEVGEAKQAIDARFKDLRLLLQSGNITLSDEEAFREAAVALEAILSTSALSIGDWSIAFKKLLDHYQEFQYVTYNAREDTMLWLLIWRTLKIAHWGSRQPGYHFPGTTGSSGFVIEKEFFELAGISSKLAAAMPEMTLDASERVEFLVAEYCGNVDDARTVANKDPACKAYRGISQSPLSSVEIEKFNSYLEEKRVSPKLLYLAHRAAVRLTYLKGRDDLTWSRCATGDTAWPVLLTQNESPKSLHSAMKKLAGDLVGHNRICAYDYVHYPFPETRAHEVAANEQITRELGSGGIISDGARVEYVVNRPYTHVLPPSKLSSWSTLRLRGPVGALIYAIKATFRGGRRRPAAKARANLSRRPDTKKKVHSPLSPTKDPARRISKESPFKSVPKLRGGGNKASSNPARTPGSPQRPIPSPFTDIGSGEKRTPPGKKSPQRPVPSPYTDIGSGEKRTPPGKKSPRKTSTSKSSSKSPQRAQAADAASVSARNAERVARNIDNSLRTNRQSPTRPSGLGISFYDPRPDPSLAPSDTVVRDQTPRKGLFDSNFDDASTSSGSESKASDSDNDSPRVPIYAAGQGVSLIDSDPDILGEDEDDDDDDEDEDDDEEGEDEEEVDEGDEEDSDSSIPKPDWESSSKSKSRSSSGGDGSDKENQASGNITKDPSGWGDISSNFIDLSPTRNGGSNKENAVPADDSEDDENEDENQQPSPASGGDKENAAPTDSGADKENKDEQADEDQRRSSVDNQDLVRNAVGTHLHDAAGETRNGNSPSAQGGDSLFPQAPAYHPDIPLPSIEVADSPPAAPAPAAPVNPTQVSPMPRGIIPLSSDHDSDENDENQAPAPPQPQPPAPFQYPSPPQPRVPFGVIQQNYDSESPDPIPQYHGLPIYEQTCHPCPIYEGEIHHLCRCPIGGHSPPPPVGPMPAMPPAGLAWTFHVSPQSQQQQPPPPASESRQPRNRTRRQRGTPQRPRRSVSSPRIVRQTQGNGPFGGPLPRTQLPQVPGAYGLQATVGLQAALRANAGPVTRARGASFVAIRQEDISSESDQEPHVPILLPTGPINVPSSQRSLTPGQVKKSPHSSQARSPARAPSHTPGRSLPRGVRLTGSPFRGQAPPVRIPSAQRAQSPAQAPRVPITMDEYRTTMFRDEMIAELHARDITGFATNTTAAVLAQMLADADVNGNLGLGNMMSYRMLSGNLEARMRPRGWRLPDRP